MKTAQQILQEHALGRGESLSHTVLACLQEVVANYDEDFGVVLDRTTRIDRESGRDMPQDDAVLVFPLRNINEPMAAYYVCDDARWFGGPVFHTASNNSYVPADYVDGKHRLDAYSGELIDLDVIL